MEISHGISRDPVEDGLRWVFMKRTAAQAALFKTLEKSLLGADPGLYDLRTRLMQWKSQGWPHYQKEFSASQHAAFDALWQDVTKGWQDCFAAEWQAFYVGEKGKKTFKLPVHTMLYHLGTHCIDYIVKTLKSDLWSDDGVKMDNGAWVETPRGFLKAGRNDWSGEFFSTYHRAASQGLIYAVLCSSGAIENGKSNSVVPGVEVRFVSTYLKHLRDIAKALSGTEEWFEKSLDTPSGMAREIAKRHKKSKAEQVEAALNLYFECGGIGSGWPSVFAPMGAAGTGPKVRPTTAEHSVVQADDPDAHWLKQMVSMLSQSQPSLAHVDCDQTKMLTILDFVLEALLSKCLKALKKRLPIAVHVFLSGTSRVRHQPEQSAPAAHEQAASGADMQLGTALRELVTEMKKRGKGHDLSVPNIGHQKVAALTETRKRCIAQAGQRALMTCVSAELKRQAEASAGDRK